MMEIGLLGVDLKNWNYTRGKVWTFNCFNYRDNVSVYRMFKFND